MLRSYLRLIMFAVGLLVGIQVPNFVDQYVQRADAHHREAEQNFRGFQEVADRYFKGDVDALIAHHEASADAVFHDEAKTIRALYERVRLWRAEWAALQKGFLDRLAHVAIGANDELRRETVAAYTYDIPLTPTAIASGVILALVLALLIESLVFGIGGMLFGRRRPRRSAAGQQAGPTVPRAHATGSTKR